MKSYVQEGMRVVKMRGPNLASIFSMVFVYSKSETY